MLKIYFDNVLINEDSYTELSNDYQLFTDSFKLGSVASNSFKLSVNKTMVSSHPSEVKIEDDNTSFYLVIDSIEEDNYVYSYTLIDKLVNFNFNYDAKALIDEKTELEETCYLSDIWHDICTQSGVEYDETYTFLNDMAVNWYDNRIQARKYLSYIAELQGGYACILPNGKQSFKPNKKASSKTINIDECSDFIIGEKKTITRVVYDNGVVFWAYGENTGTTLYLDPTNVFITSEEIVENIYDSIAGFEFYLLNVPNAPIDSNVRAGDIIIFTDGINNYPTIAQYSTSYFGDWVGGYKLEVKTDKQEETKVLGQKEIIKKIQTEIDRTNASLNITAEQTDENSSSLADLTIESNKIATTVSSLDSSINGEEEQEDNLIVLTEGTSNVNGLTITKAGVTIAINGTATANTEYDLEQTVVLGMGDYMVSGMPNNVNLKVEGIYNSGNGRFKVITESEVALKLVIYNGSTFVDTSFVPLLNQVIRVGGTISKIAEIEANSEGISSTVTRIDSGLNELTDAISTIEETILKQTENSFEMWFNETGLEENLNNVKELAEAGNEELINQSKYIRFEGGSITLGGTDNISTLVIEKEQISFRSGDNTIAYINGTELSITDSTVMNRLRVKQWEIKPDMYGNLNWRWLGGEE